MSIARVFYLLYFFMIPRKIIVLMWALCTLLPLYSNATEQLNRTPVNNCLELSKNIDALLKEPSLVEYEAVAVDETQVIDEWILDNYSSSFFLDYNEEERTITILKWPKDPKWSTVDFKLSKKIWKVKLPVVFKNIRTRIYDDKYLVIFAEHNDADKRVETIALFYDISDWKISPLSFFTHTWRLIKIHEQDWKLYVITNSPLDKNVLQNFIKKDGNLPSMFPKYTEWVKYGLDPQEKTSVCRSFRYLQMPSYQLPSFWSIIVVSLNNLKTPKEMVYLLWSISQFQFSEKALYMAIQWDWDSTIVQKFWIDPKINPQKSVKINWTVLDNWIIVRDMKTAFITKKSSWKVYQYSLVPLSESFVVWNEKVLHTSEDNYSDVEDHYNSIILRNMDKMVNIAELNDSWILPHAAMELPLKEHKYFVFWTSPLTLLDLSSANWELSFSLLEKDKPQWKYRQIMNAKYSWNWRVSWPVSWNSKTRTLMVPVEISWSSSFAWLKVLQLSNKWKISETMARAYGESKVASLKQLQEFSYAITDKFIDVFLPNNSISKKVFARK